ncbi:unnamed protein product [Schistocephalus solidus]|uniref:Uncharacterized protein n=1 Tax=Schistocephalus solidus TaxID=70667 RepID=A0A183TDI8_SCHSO|nr:unnamed protein product [Schistocephalus solidus]
MTATKPEMAIPVSLVFVGHIIQPIYLAALRLLAGLERAAPLLSADGTILLTEKTQIPKRWANTSEVFITSPTPPPTSQSTASLKWKPTPTSISCPLSKKPSELCKNSPVHLEQGLFPECQRVFRRYRGTTAMIFAAHQL